MPTQTELFLEKAMLYISKYCPELNFPRSLSNKINQYKKSFKKVFKTKLDILNICWFFPAFLAFTAFIGPLFIAFFFLLLYRHHPMEEPISIATSMPPASPKKLFTRAEMETSNFLFWPNSWEDDKSQKQTESLMANEELFMIFFIYKLQNL